MAKEKINIVLQGIDNTTKAFNNIKRNLDVLDRRTKLLQNTFKGVAVAATASLTAIGVVVGTSTARIDRLVKTSEKLGIGVEFLQQFRFAAEQVGIRTETADMALQRFSRRVAEARKGTGEAKDTLTQLGIALFDSSGQARAIEDVMFDVADAMSETTDASEMVRQSFKFFDSEGVDLVALIKNGSVDMKEFFRDAENLGAVLSQESAKGVADFADAFTRVKTGIKGVTDQFTAGLAPVLEQISEDFAQFIIDTNAEIEKLGFESLGQYLATEFLDIILTITEVLEGTFNTIIGLVNSVTERGISLGLIEESENAKALRAELDTLGTAVNQQLHRGSAFASTKLVFTEEEEKRRREILELLEKENLIAKLNFSETKGYIKEVQKLVREGIAGTTITVTEDGDDEVSRFVRTATQALENFKKDTIESMMVKGFENAFKTAEDALMSFLETGKLNFKDFVNSVVKDLMRIRIREFLTGGDGEGAKGALDALFSLFTPKEKGGSVTSGQPYMVGEKGAELFVPNRSGTIVPNHQLAGAGGITINQSVNFATGVQDTVKNEVLQLLPEIAETSKGAVLEAMNRGGNFRRGMR